MSREYTRAVLHLSCDERLVAGVGGAVTYFAERAGLADRTRESLVTALEAFCLDSLPSVEGSQESIDVAIEDFEDRIEIVVEQQNRPNAVTGMRSARGESAATAPERVALRRLAQAVDRIESDTRNGSTRTMLVKFL